MAKASFGNVRKLPSGRWQARYTIPGTEAQVSAPMTFDTKGDAQTWLSTQHGDLARGTWKPPQKPKDKLTLTAYADTWLRQRTVGGRPLAPTTRAMYRDQLDDHILPVFGAKHVDAITPAAVRDWHGTMLARKTPTLTAHCYALLRSILNTAVGDDLIEANPCRIRGAGRAQRAGTTKPATMKELAALIEAVPERYKAMVALAAWCGLRHGELAGLYRRDIDTKEWTVTVERAVARVRTPKTERTELTPTSVRIVKGTKTEGSMRTVTIPEHVRPVVKDHLSNMGVRGKDALLFPSANDPSKPVDESVFRGVFKTAKDSVGRPDLRVHDLRHTFGSNAVLVADVSEVQRLMGHTNIATTQRYLHDVEGRREQIAADLSKLAENHL